MHVGEFLKINQPWIKQAGVRTVIDIGAHNGEFSAAIRVLLPSAQVYAFEPLPDSYEKLRAKFEGDARCRAFHFAVGEQRGQVKFWRSRFSKSSSVLPMADVHKLEFPWSSELESCDPSVNWHSGVRGQGHSRGHRNPAKRRLHPNGSILSASL